MKDKTVEELLIRHILNPDAPYLRDSSGILKLAKELDAHYKAKYKALMPERKKTDMSNMESCPKHQHYHGLCKYCAGEVEYNNIYNSCIDQIHRAFDNE